MDKRPLVGLAGILLAVIAAELNDQVAAVAAADISGALGIDRDSASWLRMLYSTGQIVGMAVAPSLGLAFGFRRFALFATLLSCVSTLLIASVTLVGPLMVLRLIQGLAAGFTIPLLLTVALRVLGPTIRLWGLMCYALSATVIPPLATSLAALWTDGIGDWHFVFIEALPICTAAAVLIWWGMDPEPPDLERRRDFDWVGLVLVAVGFGSLSVVFEQGDRFDWFNSPLIVVLTLASVTALPALVVHEFHTPAPLFRFDLFRRRNFAYAGIALILFLVISLSASAVPIGYLEQVQGYRPMQAQTLSLTIVLSQLVLLPFTAWLLDRAWVDSRWVSAVGLFCVIVACALGTTMTSAWNRDQFIPLQLLQSVGAAFIIMALLLKATNALKPPDGPFASAMINTMRALTTTAGVWILELITRWRGGLHRQQIYDYIGGHRLALEQAAPGFPAAVTPAGAPDASVLAALDRAVQQQVTTLVTIDSYVLLGGLAVLLLAVLVLLAERTYPPRIALAKS